MFGVYFVAEVTEFDLHSFKEILRVVWKCKNISIYNF